MNARLHGRLDRPAVAVVGVWDPVFPAHRRLFEELRDEAHERSLAALAILLDPAPPALLHGPRRFPVYDEVAERIAMLRACGVDGVLRVRFRKADVFAGAADLLAVVEPHARLAELWLGAQQTLGRLDAGSYDTAERLTRERGVTLRRLPFGRVRPGSVVDLLAAGRLGEAATLVGRPPVRHRPRAERLRLEWCPGRYRVVALGRNDDGAAGSPFEVDVAKAARGLPLLAWPDRAIERLAFVAGPGDGVEPGDRHDRSEADLRAARRGG